MKDTTKIELIATRLMGWHVVPDDQPTSRKQNVLHTSQLPDWETNLNETWEIVQALAEVDWHLEVEKTGYLWFRNMTRRPRVGCTGLDPNAHRRRDVIKTKPYKFSYGSGPSFATAIVDAAAELVEYRFKD